MTKFTPVNIKSLALGFITVFIGVISLFMFLKSDVNKAFSGTLFLITWVGGAYFSIKYRFWKAIAIWLIIYTLFFGLLGDIPLVDNVRQSARNLYYHVTMWMAMFILFISSVVFSVLYLWKEDLKYDTFAEGATHAGVIIGFIGLVTGMLWARHTWNAYWNSDPKQVYTVIGLLLYIGYFLLRGAFADEVRKARLSAVVNIFAFPSMLVLLYVLPRMTNSLHPGSEGSTMILSSEDINSNMRIIFYPAIIGWTLVGVWIASLRIRCNLIKNKLINL